MVGPHGCDKLLLDQETGSFVVTNDGATIMSKLNLQHPTGVVLLLAAEEHEQQVGDGTTSLVLLISELVAQAESMLQPNSSALWIAAGYQIALKRATEFVAARAEALSSIEQVRMPR